MKINEKFDTISSNTIIEDYLKSCGVDDIELYLNPTYDCIEPPTNYDYMLDGKKLLIANMDKKIGILQDADGDGLFSTALMYNFLGKDDIKVYFHEGKLHGLVDKKVYRQIWEDDLDLLIIPDAGSNDYKRLKWLETKGTKCLVLDHHWTDEESEYGIIINNQLSPDVINKQATGTTVTWHFCRYVDEVKAMQYLDLCAFATVSDVVDVTSYENRAILYYGLRNINNPLLKALVKEFNKSITPTQNDVGWTLMPKLNSILRTDDIEDTKALFYALTQPNKKVQWQKGVRAKVEEWNMLDRVIEHCKTSQKKQADLTKKFVDEIEPTLDIDSKIIIGFAGDNLGGGYTGLVASKISSKYGKPCLLLRDKGDSYIGSGRSDIDIREELDNNEFTEWASGHGAAFGVEIKKDKFDDFKAFTSTLQLSSDPIHDVLYSYDYNSIPSELFGLIENNKELFGKGLPSPLFHIKPFKLNSSQIVIMGNNTTLKIPLGNLSAIKFFCSKKIREDFYEGQNADIEVELIVELSVNYWNDGSYPQLLIKEYQVTPYDSVKINWDDLI